MPTPVRKARALIGVAVRTGDAEGAEYHRRELKAAKLEQYIRHTYAEGPTLTTEQRERLAALLTSAKGVEA